MVPNQVVVKVEGMFSDKCVRSVRSALERTEGVFCALVSLDDAAAAVIYDASVIPESALLDSLSKAGYAGELVGQEAVTHSHL